METKPFRDENREGGKVTVENNQLNNYIIEQIHECMKSFLFFFFNIYCFSTQFDKP